MTITTEKTRPDAGPVPADGAARAAAAIVESIRDWLPAHCQSLPGATRAVAVVADALTHDHRIVATWPAGFDGNATMLGMAEIAFSGRSDAIREQTANGTIDRLAMPILHKGRFLGALVVEADNLDDATRRALIQRINGKPARKTPESEAVGHRLAIAMDLVATCLDAGPARAAALAFVSELAARTGCDRVSLGRVNAHDDVRVIAVSNSATIAHRSNLVRAVEAAMEEAIDQGVTLVMPRRAAGECADREHERLSAMQGDAQIMTVPLAHAGDLVGAVTLERHGATAFDDGIVALCETVGAIAGPILELKHRDERSLPRRCADAAGATAQKLVGRGHTGFKLTVAAIALVLLWMALATGTWRITAPARLEGSVNRAVVAPMEGFVASAAARAGDVVRSGELLARLDDSDLRLEIAKWQSEAEQLRKQYRGALAAHDRGETTILSARVARADAQLELLAAQLARIELRAPFDGIVVAGDLSQLLGSPVKRGDVLFEVAPLDDYRVVLEIDERDVAAVTAQQAGRLALAGLPESRLPIVIESLTPVSTARDGRNFFRAEARLETDVARLRPGMAGVAKIDAGERRLIWIWGHRIVDWLRLRLWRWLP